MAGQDHLVLVNLTLLQQIYEFYRQFFRRAVRSGIGQHDDVNVLGWRHRKVRHCPDPGPTERRLRVNLVVLTVKFAYSIDNKTVSVKFLSTVNDNDGHARYAVTFHQVADQNVDLGYGVVETTDQNANPDISLGEASDKVDSGLDSG